MNKPDGTPQQYKKDHYECERDAYNSHATNLAWQAMYNDCMRVRGYN
jgi:hypothetical protein